MVANFGKGKYYCGHRRDSRLKAPSPPLKSQWLPWDHRVTAALGDCDKLAELRHEQGRMIGERSEAGN